MKELINLKQKDLKELRRELVGRIVIGNKAKEQIEWLLGLEKTELGCKWLEATFKKNIKCGVDTKTINRIWPNLIPTFEIGLCAVFKEDKLPEGDWFVEPKMDGLRGVCIRDGKGEIEFLSRTGNPIFNVDHIIEELKTLGLRNMVFDGELMGRDWGESVGVARSEKNIEGKDIKQLKYYVFDCLHKVGWDSKKVEFSYTTRNKSLINLLKDKGFKYIIPVSGDIVYSLEGARSFYKKYLEQGFEGVVLKEANSIYPFKRSKNWLKWKPFDTLDLPIIGYEEGKNKNKGKLGKLFVDYKGIKGGVGGGYSDKLRQEFWEKRDEIVGQIIEIKHYGVTPDGSLKTAQFKRLRIDK